MKAKRLLSILLVMVMVVTMFAACGNKNGDDSNTPDDTPTNVTPDGGDDDKDADTTDGDDKTPSGVAGLLNVEKLDNPNVTLDLYWETERAIVAGDDYVADAIAEFEAKYGGKVTVNANGWGTGISVMQQNLAAGTPSDLQFIEGNACFPNYATDNYLLPLNDLIGDDLGQYYLDEASMDNFKYNDEYYAFSNYVVNKPYLVAFDRTFFENYGVENPLELFQKGQWTWDKMVEYVELFTTDTDGDGTIDKWGLGPRYKYQNFGYASDAIPVREAGNGFIEANFDTEIMLKYFEFVTKIETIQRKAEGNDGWLNGAEGNSNGAMYSEAGVELALVKDEETGEYSLSEYVDFVPMPTVDGALGQTPVWDTGLAIPKGSSNPLGGAVLAAMIMKTKADNYNDFLSGLLTSEQMERYNTMMANIVPQRKNDNLYDGVTLSYGEEEAKEGTPAQTIIDQYRGVITSEVQAYNTKLIKETE